MKGPKNRNLESVSAKNIIFSSPAPRLPTLTLCTCQAHHPPSIVRLKKLRSGGTPPRAAARQLPTVSPCGGSRRSSSEIGATAATLPVAVRSGSRGPLIMSVPLFTCSPPLLPCFFPSPASASTFASRDFLSLRLPGGLQRRRRRRGAEVARAVGERDAEQEGGSSTRRLGPAGESGGGRRREAAEVGGHGFGLASRFAAVLRRAVRRFLPAALASHRVGYRKKKGKLVRERNVS
jgi:hypothetical protein